MRFGSRLEKTFKGILAFLAARLGTPSSTDPFRFRPGLSILILRPDRLGDFILSTPALRELEKASGGCQGWTIVAGAPNESVARAFFPQAKVLVFKRSFFSRLALYWKILKGRFDLVIDLHSFPFSSTSAFMALLSGSPFRVGFLAAGDYQELSQRVFNLGVPEPDSFQHESRKSWSLVGAVHQGEAAAQGLPLKAPPLPAGVEEGVEAFFQKAGGSGKNFRLGIHPTLLKEDNRWSFNRYLELIERLSRVPGLQVFLIHGKGEGERLREFLELMGPRSHVFTLPENDLFFILGAARRLDLLVCNDSGLMHWGALEAPVLALFGPSDPRQWSPLAGKGQSRIFRSDDQLCDSITPLEVAQEIEKRMASSRR